MWKRFIFWDFPRGGWQYDVMVGMILAFLFLTPRTWFRDQPRLRKPGGIAVATTNQGSLMFFVDKEDLEGVLEPQRLERLTAILRVQMSSNRLVVTHVEPILDSEGELQGYMASAIP
jgi:hypothetical protein